MFQDDYTEKGILSDQLIMDVLLSTLPYSGPANSAPSDPAPEIVAAVMADRQTILNAVQGFNEKTWGQRYGTLPSMRYFILELFAQKKPKHGVVATDAARGIYILMNTGLGRLTVTVRNAQGEQHITLVTSDDPMAENHDLELHSVYGTVTQICDLLTILATSYADYGLTFMSRKGMTAKAVEHTLLHIKNLIKACSR